MGARSRKVYLVKDVRSGMLEAFIPHPEIPGAWLRTDPAVLVRKCPVSFCQAEPLKACVNQKGEVRTWVHGDRRSVGRVDRGLAKITYKKLGVSVSVAVDSKAQDFKVCAIPTPENE